MKRSREKGSKQSGSLRFSTRPNTRSTKQSEPAMPQNREKNEGITWIEVEEDEEPSSEEWCFVCKDGGELVICDHKNCGKVYHSDCVGKEDSFFDTVKSWLCGRHFCSVCNEPPKFHCISCPYVLCRTCVVGSSEFTFVRGVQGLCIDCMELIQIIEQNLDHDSEGNKITLTDKETYECLFKEYWGVLKEKEGLTGDDISAALDRYNKGKKSVHHENFSKDEEKQIDSRESDEGYRPGKRKRCNSEEFEGWGSKPLISFLKFIGKYETEPLTQWGVTSLILGYIKEKNLHHPKDKGKFLPDERLHPIFRKKVVSRDQIYPLLEYHFAKKLDDSSVEKNDDHFAKQLDDSSVEKNDDHFAKKLEDSSVEKNDDHFAKKLEDSSVEKNDDHFAKKLDDSSVEKNDDHLAKKLDDSSVEKNDDHFAKQLDHSSVEKNDDHFTKKLDHSSVEKNDDQIKRSSADKRLNHRKSSMPRRLSRLIGIPLLEKGDLFTSVEKNDDQIKNSSTDKCINDQSTSMRSRLSSLIGKRRLENGDSFTSVEKNDDQIKNSSTDKYINDQSTSMRSRLSSLIGKPPLENRDSFTSVEKNDDQIKNSSTDKHVNDQSTSMRSRLSSLIGKRRLENGDSFTSVEKNDDQIKNSSTDKHVNDQSTSMRSRLSSLIGKRRLENGDSFTSVEKNDDQIKNSSTDKHVNDQSTSMRSRLSSLIGKRPLENGDFFTSVKKNDDQMNNSSTDKHVNDQTTSMQSSLSSLIGKPPSEKGGFFSSVEKNDDQIENSSEDKHVNDQATSMGSRLSSLIGKTPFRKGDFIVKLSRYASINASNIKLIYLKRSLVLEFSKQTESFLGKVVGTFVRAKLDFNSRQRTSHHLVRVEGVVLDEMSKETLLQVSFMAKAIPFSKLSDEDFTEEECEDLRQKVKSRLLPRITVVEFQEKVNSLHEEITKHGVLTRLVRLQNQIDRENLRGRYRQKIELLEEKERLEKSWKQEQQLLKPVPSVRPDFIEAKYDDDDDEEHELQTDIQD